jgi:hypothetical protein
LQVAKYFSAGLAFGKVTSSFRKNPKDKELTYRILYEDGYGEVISALELGQQMAMFKLAMEVRQEREAKEGGGGTQESKENEPTPAADTAESAEN